MSFPGGVAPVFHDVEELRNCSPSVFLISNTNWNLFHSDHERDSVQSSVTFATDLGEVGQVSGCDANRMKQEHLDSPIPLTVDRRELGEIWWPVIVKRSAGPLMFVGRVLLTNGLDEFVDDYEPDVFR